jgi:hypothetical protein
MNRNRLRATLGTALLFGLLATAGWAQSPLLPDSALSPGATRAVTLKSVCTPGSSKVVRNVPESEKNAVYKEYGIAHRKPGEFEIDHLISLELGGSNDIKNLWPQSYITKPYNAHVKDKLENQLHSEICAGKLSMKDAQFAISHNWIAAYDKRFGKAK